MATNTRGLAVVLAENIYEDLELQYPRLRLVEAGYDVRVVGPEKGATYTSKYGYPVETDNTFDEITPGDVKVLVVPGGYAPDRLRRHDACNELVKQAADAGAVVGMVCHAGWVPISAGIVNGKRVTSVGAIRDDLVNAGAEWVDEPCVVDGKLVSAQLPKDLPAMMSEILTLLGDG
jgi:protease I